MLLSKININETFDIFNEIKRSVSFRIIQKFCRFSKNIKALKSVLSNYCPQTIL